MTGVGLIQTVGNAAVEVNAIVFDSRKVNKGVIFVASKGTTVDGHQFIDKAIELGAKVILLEQMPAATEEGITYLQVENSNVAMGLMAANFFGNPSRKMKVVGVTGTNGKTTNVTLLHHLFKTRSMKRFYRQLIPRQMQWLVRN